MTVYKYGVIGAGLRLDVILDQVVKHAPEAKVALKSVCDLNPARRKLFIDKFGTPATLETDDYKSVLNDKDISWVFIGTPNNLHHEHIVAALRAGKHVFAEKPLATTIEDALDIQKVHEENPGLIFATGFVLRYTQLYRKVKELLDAGVIGDLITIAASENLGVDHGGHIMTCWRRYSEISGSHILEKCCHDIDLINWFAGSVPVQVASFGGLNCFTEKNADNMSKFVDHTGKPIYLAWDIPCRDCQNPFTSKKTIVDNQVAIFEYANGVRVNFETTLCNAIPERRMRLTGTEGNIVAEFYSNRLEYQRLGQETKEVLTFDASDGHAGGDKYIALQIIDSMLNNTPPICSGQEGLLSTIASLAAEESRKQSSIIDLRPFYKAVKLF